METLGLGSLGHSSVLRERDRERVGTGFQGVAGARLLGRDLAGRGGNVELQRLGGDGGGQHLHWLDGDLGDLHGGVHAGLLLVLGLIIGVLVLGVLWFAAPVLLLAVLPGSPEQGGQRLLPGLVLHVEGGGEPRPVLVVLLLLGVREGLLLDPLCLTEGGVLRLQGLHQVLDAGVCGGQAGQAQQAEGFAWWRE